MSPAILIGIIIFGIILGGFAIWALVRFMKTPEPVVVQQPQKEEEEDDKLTLEELIETVTDPDLEPEEVLETMQIFDKYFRITEDNEKQCILFITRCLTHPNADIEVFQYFHKNVKENNPDYKTPLGIIEMKALG